MNSETAKYNVNSTVAYATTIMLISQGKVVALDR